MFHQHWTIVDTMQKKLNQKNLHAAYPYPLHYLEESWCIDIGSYQVQSPDANFLHEQSILSIMTDAYIYSLKSVLEHGRPINSQIPIECC